MADYDTPLNDEEQAGYAQKFSPEDSKDYDMQGWYKEHVASGKSSQGDPSGGDHFTDTYKKPNHPTFSEDSKYHGVDGNEGGQWHLLNDNKFAFRPGSTNFANHDTKSLSDYFKKVEPDNFLLLAGEDLK